MYHSCWINPTTLIQFSIQFFAFSRNLLFHNIYRKFFCRNNMKFENEMSKMPKSKTHGYQRYSVIRRDLYIPEQGLNHRKSSAFYDVRLHNHRDCNQHSLHWNFPSGYTRCWCYSDIVHMIHSFNTSPARAVSTWKSKDTRGRGAYPWRHVAKSPSNTRTTGIRWNIYLRQVGVVAYLGVQWYMSGVNFCDSECRGEQERQHRSPASPTGTRERQFHQIHSRSPRERFPISDDLRIDHRWIINVTVYEAKVYQPTRH